MNGKKLSALAVLVLALVLLLALIRVVLRLVSGTLRFVLGVLVLLALAGIVIWMFAYAGRNGRR